MHLLVGSGGYVKIGPKLSEPTTFGDPTPYNIMFGPDKCGYTKRFLEKVGERMNQQGLIDGGLSRILICRHPLSIVRPL